MPLLALATLAAGLASAAPDPVAITLEEHPGAVRVLAGGRPFTVLRFGPGRAKPVFHPVFGPGQLPMTRDFPLRPDTPGEARDHPHHESLWFTHGDVNGIDFWALGKHCGTIQQTRLSLAGDTITTGNDWLAPAGRRVCSDTRVIRFATLPGGARLIDFTITLAATDGDLTFGDTKEGSLGIRTHPGLNIDHGAAASNSEGTTGAAIWGRHAKWVNYQGTINGRPAGVALFDHPANPRHPTTWHARDYGLVAANPFGLRAFGRIHAGTGAMTIRAGGHATFRYALVFHRGADEPRPVGRIYQQWLGRGDPPAG